MAIPVENFIGKPQQFEGFNQAANQLERNRMRDMELQQRQESRKQATSQFLTNYLDKKDFLTGTNYDPEIVRQLQEALQQGAELAAKGANSSDIMMALGPKVNKLNQYSTKAKLIDKQIKDSLGRVKAYKGYNIDALESEAKKLAFMDENGTLRDINTIDPNTDWITETVRLKPELVTTGAGLDDFVSKTPMAEYERDITTSLAPGKTLQTKYEARHPFWMDVQRDQKGEVAIDPMTGKPIGLGVVGTEIMGDDNQPLINPETKKPYKAIDKQYFSAIMQHNPDIADYVRGQVNSHFKKAGAKEIPQEGTSQWEMMARSVLFDELNTRNKSYFKEVIKPQTSAAATKVEMYMNPKTRKALEGIANLGDDGGNSKSLKNYKVNAVEAIGKIFNNDPEYVGGERVKVDGREVIDVTSAFPGGGLKDGRGEDYTFKNIFFDPSQRTLIVEKQEPDRFGDKKITKKIIPESQAGAFIREIAEANGVPLPAVREMLDKMGYKGGKFGDVQQQSTQQPTQQPAQKTKSLFEKAKSFFGFGGEQPANTKKPPQAKGRPSLDSFDKSKQ